MPLKESARDKEAADSKPRSTTSAGRRYTPARRQTDPATIYQQVVTDAGAVSPREVLQLQRAFGNRAVTQLLAGTARRPPSRKENSTGLPDDLKAGVENLSGVSLDGVRVHYNSAKPAELGALAYTQGADIHVAPGQEKHLPHEGWHAVQQAQGRVKPTMRTERGVDVSDDAALEREADVMSAKALQLPHGGQDAPSSTPSSQPLSISVTRGGSRAPVQRVIDPQKQEYVTNEQRVTGPDGAGTIVGIIEEGYTVRFDTGASFYVPAVDLDLLESEEKANLELPENKEDLTPAMLIVSASEANKNSWNLELRSADGKTLGAVEGLKQGDVKAYLVGNKAPITQPQNKVKAGNFALKPGAELKGRLKEAYDKFRKDKEEEDSSAKQESASEDTQEAKGKVMSQKEVLGRLNTLQGVKKPKGPGHPSILMTKIALRKPVKLKVGGQVRLITHLYTQPGNPTERRCYLGNKDGAYQRVHTSITDDKTMTAHTMVQTGATVAVPPVRGGGTRIGFDSKEEGKGFAARRLKVRSKDQSTVKGSITGQTAEDLEKDALHGARLLAKRFNTALDAVLDDISRGKPEDRDVQGITSKFKILDDEWTFPNSKTATPAEEWADEQKSKSPAQEQKTTPQSKLVSTPFISRDEDVNNSVREYPGVDEVLKRYDIIFVSGRSWLCFIRAILLGLGKGNTTLAELYKYLLEREIDLTALEGVGVETGSQLAAEIIAAIAVITGQQVKITLVIPKKGEEPATAEGSIGGGGKEIFLLHTHLHFSLAKPKNVNV